MRLLRRIARDAGFAALLLLAWCPRLLALNPSLDVSQYGHTVWKISDGFPQAFINAIAQTPDGYLWLGTELGLFRFDGVKGVPWQPPPNHDLPSANIVSLLAARDGTLWIGTPQGLASWMGTTLTRYPQTDGNFIGSLIEDRDGTVWTSVLDRIAARRVLCEIQHGRITCHDVARTGVLRVYEDSHGILWAATKLGIWQWKPGLPRFYPVRLGLSEEIRDLAEADDGALLVLTGVGTRRFADGAIGPVAPLSMRPNHALRDRDGGLWIGTPSGLIHMRKGATDQFTPRDGLTSDVVTALFEDREGNIWVATANGLERFRDTAGAAFSASQGLSESVASSVQASTDGSVWVVATTMLNRLRVDELTVYQTRRTGMPTTEPHGSRRLREVLGMAWGASTFWSSFSDRGGRLWLSNNDGVGYLKDDRFIPVKDLPGGVTRAIVEDRRNVWLVNQDSGLFRLSAEGHVVGKIPWAVLHRANVSAAAADPAKDGVWLGFVQSGIAFVADDQIRAAYDASHGLGSGRVRHILLEPDGTAWVATEGGLSRLKDGRVTTLSRRNGLRCDGIVWTLEDDDRSLWLSTSCGLLRVERAEIDRWVAAVEHDSNAHPEVRTSTFDVSDGVRTYLNQNPLTAPAVKSSDGRVWFISPDGVTVIDPRRLPFNKLPPPVHIEQIIADRKPHDANSDVNGPVLLPALIRDLEIDYTALSLVAPEKNRFRIMLEGRDRDWQDVGTRRQVFYSDLPPRTYRFRVKAANNSGVWNEAGAFLDFSVAPAYYQTTWFRLGSVAAFMMLVAALVHVRQRRVMRQFQMRFEERVYERTRIARDLHDTLLQSFQGVLLNFHAATFLLPPGADKARATLEGAIEQASQAIAEGRDAVKGLRASTAVTSDLARAIGSLGDELVDRHDPKAPDFRVTVEGTPRDLAPILGDEVYRIAGEALRNAFRHARPARIEVEIHYDRKRFRLRVRDDGKGIEPGVRDSGARAGHFGLAGMQERAKLVGGTLAIWSELDSGTEIELTIPASVAYARTEHTP